MSIRWPSNTEPGYRGDRVLLIIGLLLLAGEVCHYVHGLWGVLLPGMASHPQPYYVARLACLCNISTVLIGLAMVLRSPVLGTYGIVLWALFPLQAMVNDLLQVEVLTDIALKGFRVQLLAAPLALAAGLVVRRHLLLATGLSLLGFWLKGVINHIFGAPEAQITLVRLLGERKFHDVFMPLNWMALAIGVVITAAGLSVFRQRAGHR